MADEKEQVITKDLDDNLGTIEKGKNLSRRAFIRNAVIGGAAAAATGSITKLILSTAPENAAYTEAYMDDDSHHDRAAAGREYVLMTAKEKEDMLKALLGSSNDKV